MLVNQIPTWRSSIFVRSGRISSSHSVGVIRVFSQYRRYAGKIGILFLEVKWDSLESTQNLNIILPTHRFIFFVLRVFCFPRSEKRMQNLVFPHWEYSLGWPGRKPRCCPYRLIKLPFSICLDLRYLLPCLNLGLVLDLMLLMRGFSLMCVAYINSILSILTCIS